MAKSTKTSRSKNTKAKGQSKARSKGNSGGNSGGATPDDPTTAAIVKGLLGLLAFGGLAMLGAALWSYHPADAPSPHVGVPNDPALNLIGPVGAFVAYHGYAALGPAVWLPLVWAGVTLISLAFGRTIRHPVFTAVGVVLLTAATSSIFAITGWHLLPPGEAPPEGTGGLLGLFVRDELVSRFGIFGGLLIATLVGLIGLWIAADRLVTAAINRSWALIRQAAGLRDAQAPSWLRRINPLRWMTALASWIAQLKKSKDPAEWDGAEHDLVTGPAEKAKAAKTKPNKRGKKAKPEPAEALIDEDAGEDEYEYEYEYEEEVEGEGEEDEAGADAPSAYVSSKKKFNPDELREKMAKMPINFAKRTEAEAPPPREADFSGYRFPGLDLLEDPEGGFTDEMESIVRDQAVELESAMQQYRIQGEVVGIDSGPVITLFEVRLAPGTKVSKLTAVGSDLARALRAPNIRVVPNMAGKDTVGVEVPNSKKERVRLKELMTDAHDKAGEMNLPMYLGKDASGNPLVHDLTAMPHMLIAGTTGSGKSVCMNSIIMSFLFARRPDELKLVLVDPKMVEMSQFKAIPHLMCPVVTEMGKAAAILEWAVTKMDERYELLAECGVRDIGSYNKLGWDEIKDRMEPATEQEAARIPKKLPFMVFIIDELADLMMTNKEVEGFIVRIAQKARAVGIHLILATQRPSANVVTGLIKSNMPCRVCMKVASGMDSRIVLDAKGGELLLGHGDMLFLSPRSSELTRAQGTLVDDLEIRKTVKFMKEVAEPSFEPQLVQLKQAQLGEEGEADPLFDKAVQIVIETGRGSVSLLQRRLTVGYARASRMIELMEQYGILGGHKTAQAREVLIDSDEWDAMKNQAQMDAQQTGEPAVGEPAKVQADETAQAEGSLEDGDEVEDSIHDEAELEDEASEDEEEFEYEYVDEDGEAWEQADEQEDEAQDDEDGVRRAS